MQLLFLLSLLFFAQVHSYSIDALGNNQNGQLGYPDNSTASVFNYETPVQTSDLVNVTKIQAANRFSLALLGDGSLYGFGYNNVGQIGQDPATVGSTFSPLQIPLDNVSSMATGFYHSLVLLGNGTVYSFGGNQFGELGNGNNVDSYVPIQVSLPPIASVFAGGQTSFALTKTGQLYCWGFSLCNGQTQTSTPTLISSVSNVKLVAVNLAIALAVNQSGSVFVVGSNTNKQLGIPGLFNSSDFVQIPTLSGITQVAVGLTHALALNSNGQVYGWGDNTFAGVGLFNTSTIILTPTLLTFSTVITQISAGQTSSYALGVNGQVYGWGSNTNGELGPIVDYVEITPRAISGFSSTVLAVSGGYDHSLILVGPPLVTTAEQTTAQRTTQEVTTAFFTTQEVTTQDPCATANCNINQSCAVRTGRGICFCKPPLIPSLTNPNDCRPNITIVACTESSCPINQYCNGRSCLCKPGYRLSGEVCISIAVSPGTSREAKGHGDPHFTTFTGINYDYFRTGDFVFTKTKSNDLIIHVRLFQCGPSVSCIEKIGIRYNNTDVVIATLQNVKVNGVSQPRNVDGPGVTVGGMYIYHKSPFGYDVYINLSNGMKLAMGASGPSINNAVSISLIVPAQFYGLMEGLSGDWNTSIPTLPGRGGALYPVTITGINNFAETWRLTTGDPTILPGAKRMEPTTPTYYRNKRSFDPDSDNSTLQDACGSNLAEAISLCFGQLDQKQPAGCDNVIDSTPFFYSCILDYCLTLDDTFASDVGKFFTQSCLFAKQAVGEITTGSDVVVTGNTVSNAFIFVPSIILVTLAFILTMF